MTDVSHVLYIPRWTRNQADMQRCRESVPEGGRSVLNRQCQRRPTVFETIDEKRVGFCRQHSSEAQGKRNAKRAEGFKVQVKASRRKRIGAELKEQCYRAVREMNDDVSGVAGLGLLVKAVRKWESEGE